MKRILAAVMALVSAGLLVAAGAVLFDGSDYVPPMRERTAASEPQAVEDVQPVAGEIRPVAGFDTGEVQVRDPMLVVNRDGSTAIGAYVENGTDVDVALMGVSVWVDRSPMLVNATEMWLPVLAGDQSQVGAASDAGGFVVPSGITEGTRAAMMFRFDDGSCKTAEVTAEARTGKHRLIHPTTNRRIGPATRNRPRSTPTSCDG